jgi:hypothetical protein
VEKHLNSLGYRQVGKVEINVRSKQDVPEGATSGDVVGINCQVKLLTPKRK